MLYVFIMIYFFVESAQKTSSEKAVKNKMEIKVLVNEDGVSYCRDSSDYNKNTLECNLRGAFDYCASPWNDTSTETICDIILPFSDTPLQLNHSLGDLHINYDDPGNRTLHIYSLFSPFRISGLQTSSSIKITSIYRNNLNLIIENVIFTDFFSSVSLQLNHLNYTLLKNVSFFNCQYTGALSVKSSNYIDIYSSTFSNSSSNNDGGAILLNDLFAIAIYNSLFTSNTGNHGGAIYSSQYNSTKIYNSTFLSNTAINDGGAIHCSQNISIYNSKFLSNRAKNDGGAVHMETNAIIINTVFINNLAGDVGGALYSINIILVQHCLFQSNQAQGGGAIIIYEPNILFGDVSFAYNLFNDNAASTGGAIYAVQVHLYINYCAFENNSAIHNGGAIYLDAYNTLNMSNSHFLMNTANLSGGAIYVNNGNVWLTIVTTKFISNQAQVSGGAVVVQASNKYFHINNNIFSGNKADMGGGIYFHDYNNYGFLKNNTFKNNIAYVEGGAVLFADYNDFITIEDCHFNFNHAFGRGGAISFAIAADHIIISSCTFLSNIAGLLGGGMYIDLSGQSSLFYITQSSFTSNHANNGGGILAESTFNLTIYKCQFMNNIAHNSGGGISFLIQNNYTRIIYCYFAHNVANIGEGGGMIVYLLNSNMSIYQSQYYKNRALVGSGIYYYCSNYNMKVIASTFKLNVAVSGGGIAIYLGNFVEITGEMYTLTSNTYRKLFTYDEEENEVQGNRPFASDDVGEMRRKNLVADNEKSAQYLQSSDCLFANNVVMDVAGGIFGQSQNIIVVTYCMFENNTAQNSLNVVYSGGGAIKIEGHNSFLLKWCRFHNNAVLSGAGGGVLMSAEITSALLDHNIFINNTATSFGGAIAAYGVYSTVLQHLYFHANKAQYGGAISILSSENIIIKYSVCYSNIALSYGGSIFLSGSKHITFFSNTLSDNDAMDSGGALYVSLCYNISISNCSITNNTAILGSAVYLTAFETTAVTALSYGVVLSSLLTKNSSILLLSTFKFFHNIIKYNDAIRGGTFYWVWSPERIGFPVSLLKNDWSENTAGYGIKWATQPSKVAYDFAFNLSHRSGGEIEPFNVSVTDFYKQIIIFGSTARATLSSTTSNTKILGSPTIEYSQSKLAVLKYKDIVAFGTPGKELQLRILVSSEDLNSDIESSLTVRFRNCSRGEYLSVESSCVLCPNGTYSFNVQYYGGTEFCTECPANAKECMGNNISVKAGYWRPHRYATVIIPCKYSVACKAGENVGIDACHTGYIGPTCAVCADGYRLSELANTCVPCGQASYLVSIVVIAGFIIFIIVLWRILDLGSEMLHLDIMELFLPSDDQYITLEMMTQQDRVTNRFGVFVLTCIKYFAFFIHRVFRQTPIKVLFTTYQILSNFPFAISVSFGKPFESFVSVFAWMNINFMDKLGLSCRLKFDHLAILQTCTLAPIFLSISFYIFYLVNCYFIKKRGKSRNFDCGLALRVNKSTYASLFLLLVYIILPGVSLIIFRSFTCIDVDPSNVTGEYSKYLIADMSIRCDTSKYTYIVIWASISIILFPVGIPLMFLTLLSKVKTDILNMEEQHADVASKGEAKYASLRKMQVKDDVTQLNFLYGSYQSRRWYWEVIESIRRLTLTALLALVAIGTSLQIIIGLLFVLFYMWLYSVAGKVTNTHIHIGYI